MPITNAFGVNNLAYASSRSGNVSYIDNQLIGNIYNTTIIKPLTDTPHVTQFRDCRSINIMPL